MMKRSRDEPWRNQHHARRFPAEHRPAAAQPAPGPGGSAELRGTREVSETWQTGAQVAVTLLNLRLGVFSS